MLILTILVVSIVIGIVRCINTKKCKMYRFIRRIITVKLHKYSTNEYNVLVRNTFKTLESINELTKIMIEWHDSTNNNVIRDITRLYLSILYNKMRNYNRVFVIRKLVMTNGYFKRSWLYKSTIDMYRKIWKDV